MNRHWTDYVIEAGAWCWFLSFLLIGGTLLFLACQAVGWGPSAVIALMLTAALRPKR